MPQQRADPHARAIGQNLRNRRTELALTREDLGEALGVSAQQIRRYETGESRVSADMLVKLADCLATKPATFLHMPEAPNDPETDPVYGAWLQAYHRLPSRRTAQRLISLIDGLADDLEMQHIE